MTFANTMSLEMERINKRLAIEEYWRIPWADLEIILGNRMALNMRNLSIDTAQRSREYLRNCGFDLNKESDFRNFSQFYGEALFLIRHTIMSAEDRQKFPLPNQLLHLDDPCNLFLYASDRSPRKRYQRLWACALIKVFFAITYLEYSDKLKDIDLAREQIFGKIRKLLSTDSSGQHTLTFDPLQIQLHAIDWKDSKTRVSIILKLLHKPESAVDEVFDYLGVRFVVKKECDIPILLKILVDADVVVPMNILGTRTRNSLFNLEKSRKLYELLYGLSSMDLIDGPEFESYLKKIPWTYQRISEIPKAHNPASSSEYRSLQITSRHLVRLPNPAFPVIESLTKQIHHFRGIDSDEPNLLNLVPPETAKYFPLEIQIMDCVAYDSSRFGAASHEHYKASQLKIVRERILAGMLFFTEDKILTQDL